MGRQRPTFHVPLPSFLVFLVIDSVASAQPAPLALVSAAAEPFPWVLVLAAALVVVYFAGQPEVFALVAAVVAPYPEVLVSAAEPEVVAFAIAEPFPGALVLEAALEVTSAAAEPVVFALVAVVDAAEPQVFVDIAVAFVVLVPVSVAVAEVDTSGHPKSPAFPNVYYFASFSSSVEVVDWESVDNPTGARTSYGLCNTLSTPGLYQNKKREYHYKNPNPG